MTRPRFESFSMAPSLVVEPYTVAVSPPNLPIIWPADNAPTVRVVSVDGRAAPDDPTASLAGSTDVPIENNGTVQVILQTTNFPISGVVQLRAMQKYGAATWLNATRTSGDFAQSFWVVIPPSSPASPPSKPALPCRSTRQRRLFPRASEQDGGPVDGVARSRHANPIAAKRSLHQTCDGANTPGLKVRASRGLLSAWRDGATPSTGTISCNLRFVP